ncbi:MAG: DUF1643 domain-containing protein [Eubacterium sp.]|nr:DUF1643 domain-containing protein [Eubacterium sp.]
METVKQNVTLDKTGIFSKTMDKRFEYTMERKETKGKKILVICTNPTSENLLLVDTTTNYLMNNLFSMGYSTITLCNLFAEITEKLHPAKAKDNADNMEYLKEVLKRDFDEILLGFGSGYVGNKKVAEEKENLNRLLKPYAKKLVELVDADGNYKNLKTIHPLFAGQRFSGKWEMRKFILPKS